MRKIPSLKRKLASRQVTLGSWIQLAHPAIAEIMARAGFDWLTVDLEHSTIDLAEAEQLIRTIELCGVAPLVRLSSNDPVQIKRVMDAGAHGIIVPTVNRPEEAEAAVAAVLYPPRGRRGVGLARAQGYGTRFEAYRSWLATESVVIAQIEHIDGVRNLEAILSVPGIAGFLVGPYDLSASLGVPGEFTHPEVRKALATIRRIAARHPAVAAGYHVVPPQPELVSAKIREGYRLIAYSTDMIFLGHACREGVQGIRAGRPGWRANLGRRSGHS